MGHARQAVAFAALVTASMLLALAGTDGAVAAAKGQELLANGVKSIEAGKPGDAVGTLSSAISGGSLDSAGMAKALYWRGVAYRKTGKPAQAISDLTSAIWLKGGLSEAERADALEQRTAAYREAGIADSGARPAQAAPASVPLAAKPEAAPVTSTVAARAPATAPTSPPAPAALRPAAPAPPPTQATSAWQTATAPAPSAPIEKEPATTGGGSGIGGFFSNLFSSGPGTTAPSPGESPATGLTTSSTLPTAAVSSWSDATSLSTPRARPAAAADPTRIAVATPVAPPAAVTTRPAPATGTAAVPPAAGPSPAGGKYRLQVAAVRSRDAASEVAERLVKEHGFRLDQRTPVIEEAVFGNMGTFFAVKIGPYADQNEPSQLCRVLRPSGFDCLIVTQ